MARQKKAKAWIGDRAYAKAGHPEDAPCPQCGEKKRIHRMLHECSLNYCYACHILYGVPPIHDEAGRPIIAKPKKK